MATNVEIKARLKNMAAIRERVEVISDGPGTLIPQEDFFFNVPEGRLKLRILAPDNGQLIYYQREDTAGPKRSDYYLSTTAEPQTLKIVLTTALGVRGVVRKQRWLYWVGNTRIHLDEVEGLGSFLELEVVLSSSQRAEEGEQIAFQLIGKIGIERSALVEGAYIDLLEG